MLTLARSTLLVVAPHPDDEVIGCGGLISKIKSQGGSVHVLFLTVGTTHDFTNGGSTSYRKQRIEEIKKVMSLLHIDSWRIAFQGNKYHLRLDHMPRIKLIKEIESGKRLSIEAIKPDILAIPMVGDYNQDHRASALAALTACRPAPLADKFTPPLILSYESPMNAWSALPADRQPNFIVRLSPRQLRDKLTGMSAYNSQVRDSGHPRHISTLRALAQLRGSLIGEMAAEAYYCHKCNIR